MFLLDTDIIIYTLKGHQTVLENFRDKAEYPKAISVITYGELIYGAEKSQHKTKNLAKVHRLAEIYPVVEISIAIMETFGRLKAELQKKGSPLDEFDLMIGATALTKGYCVVTNNERHFKRIPGLECQNWLKS